MIPDAGSLGTDLVPERRTVMVCIPAYNEDVAIGSVVLNARRYADRVIVIDDCSTDRTAEIAALAGAEVIQHETQLGYGGSLRTAFLIARREGVDMLVVLDGDGQHNPSEVPLLLEPLRCEEADVIIGSRFNGDQNQDIPLYRKAGIWLITTLTNLGMSTSLTDAQNGFRAFSRKAIQTIQLSESDMGASTEMLLKSSSLDLKIVEVPVTVRYDLDGSTRNPLTHGLGIIGQLLRYAETKHPLTVFGVPGAILFLAGFIQGLQVVVKYASGEPPSLGLGLVSLVLVFLGALSAFTGLILHALVGRTMSQRRLTTAKLP
jgi:glycosyltransferase involved in cell wall biosynthesis